MSGYDSFKELYIPAQTRIPAQWTVERFRNVFNLYKGLNITKADLEDTGIPCVNYGEIHSRYGFEVKPETHKLRCVSDEYLKTSAKSLLRYGDFIFADTSEDIKGSGNFTYLNSNAPAFAGYHTIIARPLRQINHRYTAYWFDSIAYRQQVQSKVNGVKVYSITRSILNDTIIAFPSAGEQDQIVRYLDWKVSQINRIINAKQRQIDLLGEQRRAIIKDALDKGVGKWESPPLYSRYSVVLGKMLDTMKMTGQSPIPYLRNIDVQWDRINITNLPIMDIYDYEYKRYTINKGDILVCEGGEAGRCAIVEDIDTIIGFQKALHRLRPLSDRENPRFLYYTMLNAVVTGTFNTDKSTLLHLTGEKLRRQRFPMPPYIEQCSMAESLDKQCSAINSLVGRINSEIDLLHEFRTRLISDVVTGKHDICGVVIPEHETVGENNNNCPVFDELTDETEELR